MRDDNRTEQATPRRLQEAREEGNVPQSHDLSRTLVLLSSLLILFTVGNKTIVSFFRFTQNLWTDGACLTVDSETGALFISEPIQIILPFFFWLATCALVIPTVTAIASRGWLFLPKKAFPDFGRLKAKGFAGIFSLDGLYRMGVGLVKLFFCAGVVIWFFRGESNRLIESTRLESSQFPDAIRNVLTPCAIQIGVFFLFLSALDLLYRRWKFTRDLRMTPDEIRREAKEENGSPELKSRRIEMIRSVGRDLPPSKKQTSS